MEKERVLPMTSAHCRNCIQCHIWRIWSPNQDAIQSTMSPRTIIT